MKRICRWRLINCRYGTGLEWHRTIANNIRGIHWAFFLIEGYYLLGNFDEVCTFHIFLKRVSTVTAAVTPSTKLNNYFKLHLTLVVKITSENLSIVSNMLNFQALLHKSLSWKSAIVNMKYSLLKFAFVRPIEFRQIVGS